MLGYCATGRLEQGDDADEYRHNRNHRCEDRAIDENLGIPPIRILSAMIRGFTAGHR